jgi:hypothetical protein
LNVVILLFLERDAENNDRFLIICGEGSYVGRGRISFLF